MPQNKACAPLFAEGFPTIPNTPPGDTWSRRSLHIKQTKQNKQTTYLNGWTSVSYTIVVVAKIKVEVIF